MHRKVALKNIVANPYRNLNQYPINKERVKLLQESIRTTTFWDNIVAREKNGKVELAYGHHRLEALKKEYPPSHEVSIIIRKLDNETMIRIMARENMEDWKSDGIVDQETIMATIKAYAKGEIQLPPLKKSKSNHHVRIAPGILPVPGGANYDDPLAYSRFSVAQFLGWVVGGDTKALKYEKKPTEACNTAFDCLESIERGFLRPEMYAGRPREQVNIIQKVISRHAKRYDLLIRHWSRCAKQSKNSYQRRKYLKKTQKTKSFQKRALKEAYQEVCAYMDLGNYVKARHVWIMYAEIEKPRKKTPNIGSLAIRTCEHLDRLLVRQKEGDSYDVLDAVIQFSDSLDDPVVAALCGSLDDLSRRAIAYRDKLRKVRGITWDTKTAKTSRLLRKTS